MHELSDCSQHSRVGHRGGGLADSGVRARAVRLRVGALASVIEDSLQFCWGITTEGTPLAEAKLALTLPAHHPL